MTGFCATPCRRWKWMRVKAPATCGNVYTDKVSSKSESNLERFALVDLRDKASV